MGEIRAKSYMKGYYEEFLRFEGGEKTKPIQSQTKPICASLLSNFAGAGPGSVSRADNNIKLIKEIIMLVRRWIRLKLPGKYMKSAR